MELLEKVANHWSTLTFDNLLPVAYISLLIVWILTSNRQEKPLMKPLKSAAGSFAGLSTPNQKGGKLQ